MAGSFDVVVIGGGPAGYVAALRAARLNRLQTAMNLALGSALATIGLTIPAVAAVSIVLGTPLTDSDRSADGCGTLVTVTFTSCELLLVFGSLVSLASLRVFAITPVTFVVAAMTIVADGPTTASRIPAAVMRLIKTASPRSGEVPRRGAARRTRVDRAARRASVRCSVASNS